MSATFGFTRRMTGPGPAPSQGPAGAQTSAGSLYPEPAAAMGDAGSHGTGFGSGFGGHGASAASFGSGFGSHTGSSSAGFGAPQQYQPAPAPPQQYQPAPAPPQQYQPTPAPPQQYQPAPAPPQQYQPAPAPPQQYQPAPAPPQPQPQPQPHPHHPGAGIGAGGYALSSGGGFGPSVGPSAAALERLQSENQRLTATIAELERGQRRLQTDLAATQEMQSKERHEWNLERARFHSLQSLPSNVQALQQEVMELHAIITNQVAEKRDSDRERQQLELAIADLRMQNLQQQGYSLNVDPALYTKVSAQKLEAAPPEDLTAVFAPVHTELYPRMMLAGDGSRGAALTPLMEMEAALSSAAAVPPSQPPSPLSLALGPFEPAPAPVPAPVPVAAPVMSPAQQLRERLRGMSEKEIERRFNVAELTEMLAVFGKLYEKPKPMAARSLYAAVTQ